MEEYINLKEHINEAYSKDNRIVKRDKVAFFFPFWYKKDVIEQADKLAYKYKLRELNFGIDSGLVSGVEITIEVDSINI
jgi:hypothetical protein